MSCHQSKLIRPSVFSSCNDATNFVYYHAAASINSQKYLIPIQQINLKFCSQFHVIMLRNWTFWQNFETKLFKISISPDLYKATYNVVFSVVQISSPKVFFLSFWHDFLLDLVLEVVKVLTTSVDHSLICCRSLFLFLSKLFSNYAAACKAFSQFLFFSAKTVL